MYFRSHFGAGAFCQFHIATLACSLSSFVQLLRVRSPFFLLKSKVKGVRVERLGNKSSCPQTREAMLKF